MSRERAQRREEREAHAARTKAQRERRRRRRETRAAAQSALTAPARSATARARKPRVGPRRSRGELVVVALAVLAVQVLVWSYSSDPAFRLGMLLISLLAAPALLVAVRGRTRD